MRGRLWVLRPSQAIGATHTHTPLPRAIYRYLAGGFSGGLPGGGCGRRGSREGDSGRILRSPGPVAIWGASQFTSGLSSGESRLRRQTKHMLAMGVI